MTVGSFTIGGATVGGSGEAMPSEVDPLDLALAQIVVRGENGPVIEGASVKVYRATEHPTQELDDTLTGEDLVHLWTEDGEFLDQAGAYKDQPDELASNAKGQVKFRAPGGVYDIRFQHGDDVDWWRGYRMGLAEARDVGVQERELPQAGEVLGLLPGAPSAGEQAPDGVLVVQDGEARWATLDQLTDWMNNG